MPDTIKLSEAIESLKKKRETEKQQPSLNLSDGRQRPKQRKALNTSLCFQDTTQVETRYQRPLSISQRTRVWPRIRSQKWIPLYQPV